LSRLGPNVWHHSPATAMAILEELEETAKLMHLATHPISPLSTKQIQELRDTFGAKW
jgi:3-dehydro-4-phosphotetronate decarboxylase